MPDGSSLDVNCASVLTEDAALLGGTIANLSGMSCGNSNQEPANKPYFYQVAAIHNTGKAASYSSAGASNWITGFGGETGVAEPAIITTDNSGCGSGTNNTANRDGLIATIAETVGATISQLIADLFGTAPTKDPSCNYTGQFNGTSSAAPSVSGITALMLEANPKLTWQDVGYILAKTARKVDDAIAGSPANMPSFTATGAATGWNLDMPWITNAAGFNFQNRYGFGLIDANAAVKLAVAYTAPAGRRAAELTTNGSASTTSKANGAGVNAATASFTDAGASSGMMRVDLSVTNNTGESINPGVLQFEITNTKTNTKSILLPAFTSWYAGGKTNQIAPLGVQKFRVHTSAFYGEKLEGNYEVRVIDLSNKSGDTGKGLDFTPVLTSFSM